ncbi:MAG: 16S rRNA (adenine(1518)-N(6)/adenine(1519)-N(6))-dimethyltransferase RsmA [Promethearchaeota archaeon]
MNYKEVNLILSKLNLRPKKHLGQNFLIDDNLLKKILFLSEVSKDDIVLEIGPGLGTLTEPLIKNAKKVYAIEINSILSAYLSEKFSVYNNCEVINSDILKIDIPPHNKVISNIPLTITGPIFEKVFFKQDPPQGILVIEKSIANRIFLTGNYKMFSRITVGVNTFLTPILKIDISKNSFYPSPKIDLNLIKLVPKENLNPFLLKKERASFFLKFISGIMPYKNKKLVNALTMFFKANKNNNYNKERISSLLYEKNYGNDRIFTYSIEDLINICILFYTGKIIKNR